MEKLMMAAITEEELEMIAKYREKKAHIELRDAYIDELNDLLQRIKKDGYTVGRRSSNLLSVTQAEPWGDAANSWINLT